MASFDQVTQRASRILIVASGPSATDLDIELVAKAKKAGVYILGVNRSWAWCRHLSGWFTLDPDYLVMRYLYEDIGRGKVQRYAAVPADYGQPDARVKYHRDMPRFGGVIYLQRIQGIGPMKSQPTLCTNPRAIHTGNSAWGALGLAYHMGPDRIGLIGVDAIKDAGYAHLPGCPRYPFHHLPVLFESAVPQLGEKGIEVRNGSPDSLVTCFPRYKPNAVVEWLMEK